MKFYFLCKKNRFVKTSFHHDQGDGYDSNDEEMFAQMLKKARNNEQILVHLSESRDTVYYLYVYKIENGRLGIGIKQMELCKDFYKLLDMFRGLVAKLLEWPRPIVIKKKGDHVEFTNGSFDEESDEIMLFKSTHNSFADSPFANTVRLTHDFPKNIIRSLISRDLSEVGSAGILDLVKDGCYNIIIVTDSNKHLSKKKKYICMIICIIIVAIIYYIVISNPYLKYLLIPN